MASSPRSQDFSQLFKSSPRELNSEKFYEAMDRHSEDLNDYNKECNKIWVKEHKGQMILICEKYLRFLNKSESWSGMFSFYDVSLLLNYWIYDKLTQIYGDTNTDDINIGFGALQGKWGLFEPNRRDKSYYKKCKPDHTKVNHEDWKNRKKLYDYYVDYDTLFLGARAIDVLCKKYYKKIKEFSSLYEYFQKQCLTQGYSCPEYFHKFKDEKREYNLEILPCREQMEQEIAAEAEAARNGRSSHHLSGSERGPGSLGDGSRSPESERATLDTENTIETSGIGKKVSHTVLGAAPVLLTATALYRYTPLGPWIRRFGGGRTNSMGAMDTLSAYTPETVDMFSDDSANYISYQPI